jgi:hypothetical protein
VRESFCRPLSREREWRDDEGEAGSESTHGPG